MFIDYYAILGVSPRASGEDIRTAFRRLALLHHPDRAPAGHADGAANGQPTEPTLAPCASTSVESGSTTLPVLSSSCANDFTDIQEAYEVLGDVARRYLYDMNYQEAMLQQEQQQQEEQARRAAHMRAIEDAARHARERERQRQALAQPRLTTSISPPPLAVNGTEAGPPAAILAMLPAAATATASPSDLLPPITQIKRTLSSSEDDGLLRTPTPPSPPLRSLHLLKRRSRGHDRGGGGGVRSSVLNLATTATFTGSKLASRRCSPQPQKTLSAPSSFLVTNSVGFPAESNGMVASALPTRAAGGRPGHLSDSLSELPMTYYYQRSIERTLRVFFDDSKQT